MFAPTKFFPEKIGMNIKNAEFYADLKFVDADVIKCSLKVLQKKNMRIFSIYIFAHFFKVFCLEL